MDRLVSRGRVQAYWNTHQPEAQESRPHRTRHDLLPNPTAAAGVLVLLTSIIHGWPVVGRTRLLSRIVDLDSTVRRAGPAGRTARHPGTGAAIMPGA
jgi:hypothetical protein